MSRDDKFKPFKIIKDKLSVYEGAILRGNRIVVLFLLRKKILKLSHETHQGIEKTKQFLRSRFFWPGMDEKIDHDQKLSRLCSESTTEQVHASSTFTVTWWSLDKRRSRQSWSNWQEIYSDLQWLLFFISGSAFVARNHLKQCQSSIDGHICQIWFFRGISFWLNGKQFVRAEFEAFLKSCGIKHARVSPYYAKSNRKP